MKAPSIALASLLAGTLLFSGCQSRGPYPPLDTRAPNLHDQASFVLLDRTTQRAITSPGLQDRLHQDGRLEVVANIRNRQNRRTHVQVNCEFKDEQGFVVDATPFQTLILSEHEQKSVRFISMDNRARRYTVQVRQPR